MAKYDWATEHGDEFQLVTYDFDDIENPQKTLPRHGPSGVDGYGWIMPASWITFARPTRPSPDDIDDTPRQHPPRVVDVDGTDLPQ